MTSEAINSVIDNISTKLAVPASKLIEILPRIGYRSVYVCIAQFIISGVFFAAFMFFSCKFRKSRTLNEQITHMVIAYTMLGFSLFSFIIGIMNGVNALLWVHDPEAWALNYILNNF